MYCFASKLASRCGRRAMPYAFAVLGAWIALSTWAANDNAPQGVPWQPSPINLIPASNTPLQSAAEQPVASEQAAIAIRAPLPRSTVRGSMVVQLDVPPLADGQSLHVYLDGHLVAETRESTVTLDAVARGMHHVEAILHAGTEPIARTGRVEFYVQKPSVLLRPRPSTR